MEKAPLRTHISTQVRVRVLLGSLLLVLTLPPHPNGRVTPSEGQGGFDQVGTKHPPATGADTWGDLFTCGLPVLLLSREPEGLLVWI